MAPAVASGRSGAPAAPAETRVITTKFKSFEGVKRPCETLLIPRLRIFFFPYLVARLRGRAATQRSKKGSEKVLGRVLGKGSGEGFWGRVLRRVLRRGGCYGFNSKKRVLRRVLRRGSEKGVSRRYLERRPEEYARLGVPPTYNPPAAVLQGVPFTALQVLR